MSQHDDTIAALATAAGTSAIALIRVSGPDTQRLAAALLRRVPPVREAVHGDYRSARGLLLDDVLFTFFRGPRSYSGEDTLEISCHGNPFIAQAVLEDLFTRGCRPSRPGEFTQRAFLNGRMELSQAEAVMDLIRARSDRALMAANQQLRGALGKRMADLIDRLLAVLARIEAYIDFPDEDLPPEDRTLVLSSLQGIAGDTGRLLATSHYGELLRDGIKTVILGAPNVGKSSLLNRLVGHDRALVSPEPGTTRDFLEERIIVGPHCLRIIDTAGLNPSPAPLESLGMAKALERAAEADLFLLVLDATLLNGSIPAEVASRIADPKALVVINKSDLLPDGPRVLPSPAAAASGRTCWISALSGAGITELTDAIVELADSFRPETGTSDLIAINARHAHALAEARDGLERAIAKLRENGPVELIASDLRTVLSSFGEITGKVDNERMLDQLFATFCIGK
ncbi:MAG: tRNA uridine-5-carboxymethylaminomethyl(34) synthesis GTPase MnmE [Opitutaceae bacterium]|nr:tRNA uridine-5-carboxymethylaminomethyl(34) synthesis GTPase MnmE [Opitutaceae bacterium]